jgi:asparagine synthase (glutamine-hydrolysing)
LCEGKIVIRKYWEFTPSPELRFRDDEAYEEQFRSAFTMAVRRRLRSEQPLLAELSGGVDSSSIVCVADALLAHERGLTPRLDTFSYYDDREPHWDERPYFALVEARRGRQSFRARVDSGQDLAALFEGPREFCCTPTELLRHSRYREAFRNHVRCGGYGGVLSGIGGDEFTGGVPTPIPELSDLLASLRIGTLVSQLKTWALSQRRPWMHVLFDTVRAFAPSLLTGTVPARRPPAWVQPQFRRRYRSALTGYDKPLTFWGPRPSFQENLSAVEALQRQLAASNLGAEGSAEKRYPFLDVDFLQFLFSVPRNQLVQPGRRRALMRRALGGIVPDEILNRKRKAYVTRAPRLALVAHWKAVQSLTREMASESLGIVSSGRFRAALDELRGGKELSILPVHRTLLLECWLRHLFAQGGPCPPKRPEPVAPRSSEEAAV